MKKIADTYFDTYKLPVGTKIKFKKEKHRYTVRASNAAFAICTKPMNALKTVLYTVIDWNEGVRGTENLVLSEGAESEQECQEMLKRLTNGDSEVSHRNRVELDVENITLPTN